LAMARFPFVFFVEREWTARLSQLISRRGRNFWKRITSFERQAGCWFEKFLNSVRDGINHRLCRVHRAGLADINAGDVVGVGFLPAVDVIEQPGRSTLGAHQGGVGSREPGRDATNALFLPRQCRLNATLGCPGRLGADLTIVYLRPYPMKRLRFLAFTAVTATLFSQSAFAQRAAYDALVATHAGANGVPVALVHRVIVRESRYQPRLIGRGGTIGLMQIKLATARGLGYTGNAEGLRDPNTNLTYGVKYLAGAYRVAHGDHNRAVHYYASGYYYAAKRQRLQPAAFQPLETSGIFSAPVVLARPKYPANARAQQVPFR
jgi:hypothetical protein